MEYKRRSIVKKTEQLFFKKRIVFLIHSDAYSLHPDENELFFSKIFKCGDSKDSLDEETMKMLASIIGTERLETRLKNSLLTLYTAYERESNLPVGFGWSVMASSKTIWHDKFPISPGTTYVFNAHVLKDHRRRGIYKLLKAVQLNHLFFDQKVATVITLVEESNTASIKSQDLFGFKRISRNYLVKFFGRNVLSIFVGEFKGWYCVLGKTKSHNL